MLLRRGCTWTGGVSILGSGARGRPLTFSAYGTGSAPAIGGPGNDSRHALVVQRSYTRMNLPVKRWFRLEAFLRRSANGTGRVVVWQNGVKLWDLNGVTTKFPDGARSGR